MHSCFIVIMNTLVIGGETVQINNNCIIKKSNTVSQSMIKQASHHEQLTNLKRPTERPIHQLINQSLNQGHDRDIKLVVNSSRVIIKTQV